MIALARRLGRDRRGLALTEFAFIFPILLLLFVGGYQISDGVFAYRKVTLTARTIADVTSRYTTVTNGDLDTILAASEQVLNPYKLASAEMRISRIDISSGGTASVVWSRGKNTTGYAVGASFYVPAAYRANGVSILVADVTYHYVPGFASPMIGNIDLKEQVTMYPRKTSAIPAPTA